MLLVRKFYNGTDIITVFIIYLLVLMGLVFWSRKKTRSILIYSASNGTGR